MTTSHFRFSDAYYEAHQTYTATIAHAGRRSALGHCYSLSASERGVTQLDWDILGAAAIRGMNLGDDALDVGHALYVADTYLNNTNI